MGIFFLNLIYFLTISADALFLSSLEIGKTISFAFLIASTAAIVSKELSPGPTPTTVNDARSLLKPSRFFRVFLIPINE